MSRVIGSYSLPSEVVNQLRETAKHQDRPISWVVKDALILYLSQAFRTDNEEVPSYGESSDPFFDIERSLRIDKFTILLESEPNAFCRYVLTCCRARLEQAIPYED